MKSAVTAFLIAILLISSPVLAADDTFSDGGGGAIITDLIVVRPVSIVATAVGCCAFVAALPFTVWSKERISTAGNALVVKPGKFAFVRPLGEEL
jgi:hypothetical protein